MAGQTDATSQSFIQVPPDSHFPIQNLPYGVFKKRAGGTPRVGVAIGAYVLDLSVLEDQNFFDTPHLRAWRFFSKPSLNDFMKAGRTAWREARSVVRRLLSDQEPALRDDAYLREHALVSMQDVEMLLPAEVGDFTDFYASKEHAYNVGSMFRGPENALMPNWVHMPVAYHGRSSSVVVSGTSIHRPRGQVKPDDADLPSYGASRLLDFELEAGFFVGPGNQLGEPISVEAAPDHIFGLVLVNDWSARDIQKWEYVPLGPFLGKNFATSISPWVVTLDALEPFRCAGPRQEPEPLEYLRSDGRTYDICLEVLLQGEDMPEPYHVCRSNLRYLYWNMSQQLAHHTVNGCNARPGDLMASGTISGPTPASYGSMLERAWRGTRPVRFPNGETRSFVHDYDTVVMTGWAQGDGYRVGFGEVRNQILPAG